MRVISYFSLFLVAIIAFAGCKSSSTSPGSSETVVVPNPGSYFVTVDVSIDSTGAIVSTDTSVETFFQTGLSIFGKTNVIELIDSADGSVTDTGYIHYESDGDVSSYAASNVGGLSLSNGWITFPFASQQPTTFGIDTSFQGQSLQFTEKYTGAGQGSITIEGKQFSEQNINSSGSSILSYNLAGKIISDTSTFGNGTVSFAPSLGEVVEQRTPGAREPITKMMGNSDHSFVIRYVLK